jgi:hypothetical protein
MERGRLVKFTNISQDVQKLELAPAPVLHHAVPTLSHSVVVKKTPSHSREHSISFRRARFSMFNEDFFFLKNERTFFCSITIVTYKTHQNQFYKLKKKNRSGLWTETRKPT